MFAVVGKQMMSWMHSIAWSCRDMTPVRLLWLPQEFGSCQNMQKPFTSYDHLSPYSPCPIYHLSMVHLCNHGGTQHPAAFSSRCWIWTFRPCSCPELIQGSLRKISQPKGIQDTNKPFTNTETTYEYHFWGYKWLQSSCRTNIEKWRLHRELCATQRLCNTLPMHVALGRHIIGLK